LEQCPFCVRFCTQRALMFSFRGFPVPKSSPPLFFSKQVETLLGIDENFLRPPCASRPVSSSLARFSSLSSLFSFHPLFLLSTGCTDCASPFFGTGIGELSPPDSPISRTRRISFLAYGSFFFPLSSLEMPPPSLPGERDSPYLHTFFVPFQCPFLLSQGLPFPPWPLFLPFLKSARTPFLIR